MPATEALYLAAEFKIAVDGMVAQHPEAVNNSERLPSRFDNLVRVQSTVSLVPHC
jgi:hypothetical protein